MNIPEKPFPPRLIPQVILWALTGELEWRPERGCVSGYDYDARDRALAELDTCQHPLVRQALERLLR